MVFKIEGAEPWDEENGSLLKYGCYKSKDQILGASSKTIHEFFDQNRTMQVRFEVKESGTYKFVAKYDSVHVDGSPLLFLIGQPKSEQALTEAVSQISIGSPVSKSSENKATKIDTEDESWSPSPHTVGIKPSKFKFDEKKDRNVAIVQPKLSSNLQESLSNSRRESDF